VIPQHITDVIWIQTAFIGDIILTTAAISGLKATLPHINQHLITTPVGEQVLKSHPALIHVWGWDKRLGFKGIRPVVAEAKEKFSENTTVIIQVHTSFRSSLLSRWIGFHVITYEESKFPPLRATRVERVTLLHETSRVSLLLEPLGVSRMDSSGWRPVLPRLAMNEALSRQLAAKKLIAIAPGSVWATKRWTPSGFRDLIGLIQESLDYKLVLIGSKAEVTLTDEILKGLKSLDKVVNLVGKTSLEELLMIFPNLSALVSGDSSPVHYASAYNIPSVVIFGATVPSLGFASRSDKSEVVEIKDLNCRPCSDHGPKSCPLGHFQCMRRITGRMVFEALLRIL
jgi:heptosyltransferase-2